MLDRVLKLLVTLALLLLLVQVAIRVIDAALMGTVSASAGVSAFFARALADAIIVCFFIGLISRGVHLIAGRDPRAVRERASRERGGRQRRRQPAEGVPPMKVGRRHPPDTDPAIGNGE